MTATKSPDSGTERARTAFESYRRATAVATSTSMEALLRCLILDLGQFAAAEGIAFMPVIGHAQAWWLRESAKAKERPKAPPPTPTGLR